MIPNIRNILTFIFYLSVTPINAEQIWHEQFLIPDKGIWGDEETNIIQSDFTDIHKWYLEYDSLFLSSAEDYAKTVSTSGGRFEVRDIEGEIKWISEWIMIDKFKSIEINLTAKETGNGANESNKYLKAYFRINGGEEILFKNNGINKGNWGSVLAEQEGLNGDSIQIIIYIMNHYSADKVILDEVTVTGSNVDIISPYITEVKIRSADTLSVYFNEPINVDKISSDNFSLFSNQTEIYIASVQMKHTNCFLLNIETVKFADLKLCVSNIYDLENNITQSDTYSFQYLPPVFQYHVVINEIMADPYPARELPAYEYVELLNKAEFPVQLKDWKIKIDGAEKYINEYILLPGDFLILTSTGGLSDLLEFGNVLSVRGFSSIKNNRALIELISSNDQLIDKIEYSREWTLNKEKSYGGWSVERIDPDRFCGQGNNWEYSENLQGGTPGKENSIKGNNKDTEPPQILNIEAITSKYFEIQFSENMDTIQLKNLSNYLVSDGPGDPYSIDLLSDKRIGIYFSDFFTEDVEYMLELKNTIDECGNFLTDTVYYFSWSVARQGDIVINEVLSNPLSGGIDFVEFYNNSEKILHLDHLYFSNGKDTVKLYPELKNEVLFNPDCYLVCTKDSAKVIQPYFSACPENVIKIQKFPNIYNNKGVVFLMNENLEIVDRFLYSEEHHTPFFVDIEGVSLERISFDSETNEPANWYSAAESYGFATPGCENSQAGKGLETSITFEPQSFSPNIDGYNDEYSINYQFNKPGFIANTTVFNLKGNPVLCLTKNEVLAIKGSISWNGEDENGDKLPIGVYVILFEVFDLQGNLRSYKDAVVLTDVFE